MLPEYSSMRPDSRTLSRSKKGFEVGVKPFGKAASRGRMAGLIQVTAVAEGVSPGVQSRAARTALLGVFSTNGTAVLCFSVSKPAKKKSLSDRKSTRLNSSHVAISYA